MFYGEYKHTLDRKGRLIIPSKFRDALAASYTETLYITRGLDKCLFVFTETEWKTQEAKFKSMPFTKTQHRKFNRLFFSGAADVTPDKQARVLLPGYLKQYAGIDKDVIFVGVSNRIEIWAIEKWQEYYNSSKDSFEEIAETIIEE